MITGESRQSVIDDPVADGCLMYLLRHGATPPNLLEPPVMQGKGIDEPLAEIGRQQAGRLGAAMADRPVRAVYSSPLRRAVETAEALAAPHGLSVQPVNGLVEVEVGLWEGLTWDQVESRYPDQYRAFREDPAGHGYPEGETMAELHTRVEAALTELLERHAGEQIAVVAHSVVNRVYLGQLLGLSYAQGRRIPQHNCAINAVRRSEGRTRVMTVNSFGHLL